MGFLCHSVPIAVRSSFAVSSVLLRITSSFLKRWEKSYSSSIFGYQWGCVTVGCRCIQETFSIDLCTAWLSGNEGDSMTWVTQKTETVIYHQTSLQSPVPFGESRGQALDGTVYYAMLSVRAISYFIRSVELTIFRVPL